MFNFVTIAKLVNKCISGVSTQIKLGRQKLKPGSRGAFYITTVTITIIITIIASNDGVKS